MNHSLGIEDIYFAFPSLYLSLSDLAVARDIEPAKLQKGLGLFEMSVCDVHEDVITLAADALLAIVKNNNVKASELGRIYVGTESSIDGSKPIASYLLGILTQYYMQHDQKEDCLRHVDVVDMTFACIGAVDAMHNSLAWMQTEPEMKAIVVATDIANYDLASSGEYTQGAGACALLLSKNPALMTISSQVGVASACVHDFFKPLRLHGKNQVHIKNSDYTYSEEIISIHRETPIFDGPLSNKTYQNRIREAYENFLEKTNSKKDISQYDAFIFHLPYAYHGRRIFDDIFLNDLKENGKSEAFYNDLGLPMPDKLTMGPEEYKSASINLTKAISKSAAYSSIVNDKIERGERLSSQTGNVYTASIFLSLLSALFYAKKDEVKLQQVLFLAYGSGSKSKVFQGNLMPNWEKKVKTWDLENQLTARKKIDFETYVKLRLHQLDKSVSEKLPSVEMDHSGILETNRYSRNYVLVNNDF